MHSLFISGPQTVRVLIEGMSTRAWFISFTDFGACAIDFHCIVYSPACHVHRRSAPHPSHQCFVVVVEDMKTLELLPPGWEEFRRALCRTGVSGRRVCEASCSGFQTSVQLESIVYTIFCKFGTEYFEFLL